jgi:uncharacterized membrane protein
MTSSGIHYFPIPGIFLLLLAGLLGVLCVLLVLNVLRFAYARIGIAPQYFFAILVLTLVGSYINIPLLQFPDTEVLSPQHVTVFGIPYVVPLVEDSPGTLLAINVGGGLIPILLSIYLIVKNGIHRKAAWGVLIVAIACYVMASPVAGVGITIPIFYPPLVTAVVALVLSRTYAAPLAYASGSLGTLVGADLFNLPLISEMQAPVMSIGGAGTFDAIFLTGLLAGVLASVGMRRTGRRAR